MKKFIAKFTLITLCFNSFAADPFFNIKDFGATGIRTENASDALLKAIDTCHKLNGGTVYIPAGNYSCLPIVLYDNITLFIDAGATLYVDLPNPLFKGRSFIYAENAKNITIKGRGVIDGQASYEWTDYRSDDVEIAEEIEIARQAGVELKRSYRVGHSAFSFLLKECENVLIEDVTILNTSLWCMKIWGCNYVTIRGIQISSDLKYGVNSDGIDIDATSNVQIYGCNISTGDDAICIKTSTWDKKRENNISEPVGSSKPSENIIVDNCILTSSSTALMIGTETNEDIRHVVFSNCVIRNSNKGIGINVQDGGTVSDVVYSNITMDLRRREWFWWGDAEVFYFVLKKRLPESKTGAIKNILVNNIVAHAQGTSRIISKTDLPVENITLSNIKIFMESEITPDKRSTNMMKFSGVRELKLNNIELYWNNEKQEPKWKSAVLMENVSDFEMRGISARQPFEKTDVAAINIVDCTNGIITNCFAQKGTGNFIQVTGGKTRNLYFSDNFSSNAVQSFLIEKEVNKKEVTVQK